MKLRLKKRLASIAAASLLFSSIGLQLGHAEPASADEAANTPFETEVIVRTVNQFKNNADVQSFVNMAEQYGVNVISMNVKQDEDDEVRSGQVFYNSSIARIAEGYEDFDALQAVIDAAHEKDIKVHAWIPQFHDQEAFLENSDWQMKALVDGVPTPFTGWNGSEYFVNPLHHEVQAYERSIILEVIENYDVDGVVLDWIRFDDYNMDVSEYTVDKYETEFGYSPLEIDFSTESARRSQWNEWRTDQIGEYVGGIRSDIAQSSKPNTKLGVYILPPEFVEVGQDVSKFKQHIDFVAPMAYFDDWGFESDWVYSNEYGILKDTSDLTSGANVEIVATLDNDWTDDEYQEIYKGLRENYPDVKRLSFFAYQKWPESELIKIKERKEWPMAGWTPPVEQDYGAELPEGWKARNIGLKPGAAKYEAANGQFILSGHSTDIWGNMDQLNYVYKEASGDMTMIVKVKSMEQMSGWAKAGVMIRESLDRDSKHADMMLTPENGATFQYRQHTRGGMADQTADAAAPLWLKLSRSGDDFTGYISADGDSWEPVGSITIPMDEQVYVGIALSNPDDSESNQAVIENVELLEEDSPTNPNPGGGEIPQPWTAASIGSGTSSSQYDAANDSFTVKSTGTDIWGTSDAMHYIYQPLNGDGHLMAKVAGMTDVSEWAKAGVMIRESIAANAAHADMMMTPNVASFQFREQMEGSTADTTRPGTLPAWVKIVRTGDTFIGFVSSDGSEWTKVGEKQIAMPDNAYAGLAVSNPGGSSLSKIMFEEVLIYEGTDAEPPTAPGSPQVTEVTSDTIALSWMASTDNIAVSGYEISYGERTVFTANTAIILQGLTANTTYDFLIKAVDLAGNRSGAVAITASTEGYNVLKGHNWNQMSGATMVGSELIVKGLGRGIIPLGNQPSQPAVANPPINLRGPQLNVSGNFMIDFELLASQQARPSVQLYGALPIIQDEWREEGKYVSMELHGGKLHVKVYDGLSAYPDTAEYSYNGASETRVSVASNAGKLVFYVNQNEVGQLDDPGVFDSHKVYFGADAAVGKSFMIQAIYAKPLDPASTLDVQDQQFSLSGSKAESLRSLATKNYSHLSIGTAVSVNALISDPQYAEILGREFNMITPENDMKFQFIHPQRNEYAFAEMDALMEYAELHNMKVHGHTMAWSEAVPRWVTDGNFSKQELKTILEEHITTVVSRYPKIMSWDIINEPMAGLNVDPNIRPSIWYDKLGEEYIEIALRAAHAANPAAKLYVNEYWIEEDNIKSNAVFELVKGLKQRGVPVHGVGFQMHEDLTDQWDPVSAAEFKATATKFANIGIEVRVSELDMNIHKPVNAATLQEQADYFGEITDMVKKFKVNGIKFNALSMWGFTDRYSSLQPHHSYGSFGNGLIFDENYGAKPAYDALVDSLKEPGPANPNPDSNLNPTPNPNPPSETDEDEEEESGENGKTDGDGNGQSGNQLKDIGNHWAKRDIEQAVQKGFVKGYPDGSFQPDRHVSRAEFVHMLVQALKVPQSASAFSFADQAAIGSWAQSSIAAAAGKGWITGYQDGSLRPNDGLTRAELAVIVARALQLEPLTAPTEFSDDSQIPDWARGYAAALQSKGVLLGKTNKRFAPIEVTTRAEAVKVILSIL
ncbi:endo-1,4-beta-xylanase [Paenibacillus sp. GXUN7292]|uniref:endo-1,4-beta-xylanase n=1 Tax=Paenibacillus sp. GXUN7292 TaxID=3422499 RepID=UPI003D7CD6D6